MKLVLLTNILTPYRIPLFEAIRQRAEQLTVLLSAEREDNRQWKLGEIPFQCEILPGFHGKFKGREFPFHLNYGVMRTLRRLDPDVVVGGGVSLVHLSAFLYCKLFRKKYVSAGEISLRDGASSSYLRRCLRQVIFSSSDGWIGSSSETSDVFIHYGAPAHRVRTCLMPIDVTYFHEKSIAFRESPECKTLKDRYTGPILLSIGRITKHKGYQELFEIYERILIMRPDVSLVIVGDGPDRTRYEKRAQEKGWRKVHFVGFAQSDELPRYLAIADVFVFHTLFDTFGAVLSEAMAAELLVFSSVHAAATRDLVDDGVTGFRIDPRDAEASATTILRVLNMAADERSALGRAAYARVKQTDISVSADSIVGYLESVLDNDQDRVGADSAT